MRVLITGGLGVNGAWVVRDLLERGHDVSVFEARDDTSLIADVVDRVEIVVGDLRDGDALTAAVSRIRPDTIVHLAAFVDCDNIPYTAIEVNIGGTSNVAAAALAAGVRRVVYTSTKGVYAPALGTQGYPDYEPVSESDVPAPIGMYGITKLAGEQVLDWYARTTTLECASLRFGTIFGPGRLQRHQGTINTYSSMIELPARGEAFHLAQGGDERDDIVYVRDVASAIATVAVADAAPRHAAYNVAHGRTVSMHDVADAVRRAVPGAIIDVGAGRDPMRYGESPYYMALDSRRFAEEFGWKPAYDLDRAVADYRDAVVGSG